MKKQEILNKTNKGLQVFKHYLDLVTVVKEIFDKKGSWNYTDLCNELQTFMEVKERTAKNYIKYMREKEIIIKDLKNDQQFLLGLS